MAIHTDHKDSLENQQHPVTPNFPGAQTTRHPLVSGWKHSSGRRIRSSFRVHTSVLSLQSSVFRDMLASPMAEDLDVNIDANEVVGLASDSELHEGLPLVILPEDGEDFEHLLKKCTT